ncbi:mannosyltransferase [Phialemonium atrogriseum]|uniref:GPI mannosyltransferase 1 n=1 Tax=Phialemonium atrogriseum TaxID=1093897 RepID=A0AAJ0BS80_9PEZI|nr:mannosyltransferase [Phialemonium atrogriseum]KAK1762067.1 mannosyltransferase [Phialemonium atrogriseum]
MRAGPSGVAGRGGMHPAMARRFAAVWLLNPMVATISTRGSSEGLLGVLVVALLWAVLSRRITLAGLILGFGVHFKIYPFIYAPAIVWWMDDEKLGSRSPAKKATKRNEIKTKDGRATAPSTMTQLMAFLTPARIQLAVASLGTFLGLNILMFSLYGTPFVTHTYLHHVTRIDHRHNFSPYNTQLYLTSAFPSSSPLRLESLAFIPQLLLSCVLIPLATAKKDLPASMLAQTFAFVTFNKVCTSQYFLWYMVFLPLYLPGSSFLRGRALGPAALALWVVGQGLWLQQGFGLEFLGRSTFLPGLWLSSLAFFLVNCWVLGVIVGDVVRRV